MTRRLLQLCLLAATVGVFATPAFADRDVVQFGSTIHVARDSSIHDAVCFFCNVDADGTVEGDIVVFFGNIHIANHANHDVVNFFGSITADDNASIGQDMVSMFGSIRLGEDVAVGKDLVEMFGGGLRAASTVTVGGDRVVQPGWIFWGPLLIIALIVIIVVRELRNQRRRLYARNYPYHPQP